MKHFLIQKFQKALNQFLSLDPESAARMKGLEGKIVRMELQIIPPCIFAMQFSNNMIEILPNVPENSDIVIKGTPLSLLHLSMTPSHRKKQFFREDVIIEGNLELGQQVTDLFDQLEIDWEEHLSSWIGDVPAHQIGRMARHIKRFGQRVGETFSRNINEYVHEEAELFPPSEALQDFFADVDVLRMDVDRAEARILKIKRSLEE